VGESDDERLARLRAAYQERPAEQDQTHPGYRAAFEEFAGIILVNGGDLVVPPRDPDILIGPISQMDPVDPTACSFRRRLRWVRRAVSRCRPAYRCTSERRYVGRRHAAELSWSSTT
jgi:hypothetical protein